MLKKICTSLALVVLAMTLGVSGVWASGKMQVKIGDRVNLFAESQSPSATFKWVVKQGDSILSTQTTRNFTYPFTSQGDFTINLTSTDGKTVDNTSVDVLAGDLFPKPIAEGGVPTEQTPAGTTPLNLVLETLPPLSADKSVHLLGDSGKVTFNLSRSTGDIVEYRIDKNIYVDTDKNGTGNDDIDNASDTSYLTGQPWETDYKSTDSAVIVAEITLVDKAGRKAKQQISIVFDPLKNTGDPVAVLDVSPAPEGQPPLVHLYDDPHKVVFYSRRSTGKILEYRIDKDIFTDSNGDGNLANDIDNLNDISFKTGDPWVTEYTKSDKQIIAQLTVVGEGGKGSRVQVGLVFGSKPLPPPVSTGETTTGPALTADKDIVVKGDPITFTVTGLAQAPDQYTFDWDFNGDGQSDQQTEGVNTIQNIYDTAGVYTAKVKITDKNNTSAEKTLDVVVKDTVVTKADFSFEVNGNAVTFKNLSTAAINLADKRLSYQWSFGDTDTVGFEKQKDQVTVQEPTYTYAKAGKYVATLTVTDSTQVTDSKSSEIEIKQDLPATSGAQPAGETPVTSGQPATGGSLFLKIVKVLLYLILIVIVLLVLLVGGMLLFLKLQNPSLTFEELVAEFKHKLLSVIGIHEFGEAEPLSEPLPKAPATPAETPEQPETPEAPVAPATSLASESLPADTSGETPAWAQKKEIIEGEVAEEKKDDNDKTPPPPVGEQGPVPDWLKGVK